MATTSQDPFLLFKSSRILTRHRAPPVPEGQWNKHRGIIEDMYIGQEKTLNEVVETMKRDHNFNANPRQYTEKFKSWHLKKNESRKMSRKPRCTASIYRVRTSAESPKRSPVLGGPGRTSLGSGKSNAPHEDSAVQLNCRNVYPFMQNQMSSAHVTERGHRPIDALLEATQPAEHMALLPIAVEDDDETPGYMSRSVTLVSEVPEAYGRPLANIIRTSASRQMPHTAHGTGISSSEPSAQLSPKERNSLILAIWGVWNSGDFHQFKSISNVVKYYHRLGVGIGKGHPIALKLAWWTLLYPRRGKDIQPHSRLRSAPDPNASSITWKKFAEHGYVVASQKTQMNTTLHDGYVSRFTGRLLTAMLLAPNGSSDLRLCFHPIFASLEPILRIQKEGLDPDCERLAALFPLRLAKSENPEAALHSHQIFEAAMLAMVCDRQLKASGVYGSPAFGEVERISHGDATFSMERILVWAARLMLYYASPTIFDSPLPSDLCMRALSGCRRILDKIYSRPLETRPSPTGGSGIGPLSDKWQDANFANIWTVWICCDSDFFLHDCGAN